MAGIRQCFCEHGTNSPKCCVNRLRYLTENTPIHKASKQKPRRDVGYPMKWLVPEENSQ